MKGYVIGKEVCTANESKEYWLIDFTYGANNLKVGDTLLLNGNTYSNVLKTKQLDPQLKLIGLKVSIDYNVVTTNKVITTGCTVSNPVTHALKEISIINQFEIR